MIFGRVFNARRIVLLFALVLSTGAMGVGVGVWKAEPAEAVIGGTDAQTLGGQVQLYTANSTNLCSGTLIGTKWVLTANHCFSDYGGTAENSGVRVGDARLGEGQTYTIESITPHPEGKDAALVELEGEAPPDYVTTYGTDVPEFGDAAKIRGWGRTSPDSGAWAGVLQEATIGLSDQNYSGLIGDRPAGPLGARLLFGDVGQGVAAPADSGAGLDISGSIHGILIGGDPIQNPTKNYALPTADIADWIQDTTGVGPDEGDPMDVDSPDEGDPMDVDFEEDVLQGSGGCEAPSQAEPGGLGKPGGPAKSVTQLIKNAQNSGELVKEFVAKMAERNPKCNVMVIQQETYGEPENISGVEDQFTEDFGTVNTFDVYVFDSGTFTNDGDMGYENWAWYGNVTNRSEDGRTVTFEPIG